MLWLLQERMVKCTIRIYFNMINTYHKSFGKVFGIGLIFDITLNWKKSCTYSVHRNIHTHSICMKTNDLFSC